MRTSNFKSKVVLKAAVLAAVIFLLGAGASFGQQVVNLTAGPAGITLPDGVGVPMWGYSCGVPAAPVASSASTTYTATSVTDGSGTMVVNAYIGYTVTVSVTSGTTTTTYTGTVASNTSTTLTLTAAGWTSAGVAATPTNGSAFTIAASTAACTALHPLFDGTVVGSVAVVNGGSGYTSAPTVTLSAPTGTSPVRATAVANIQNGQVVSISVTNPGHGYLAAPTVMIAGTGIGATANAGLWWSPVVITVPTGQALTINLTNNLSFTPQSTGATANNIPTSIMIVGQVGGGLGGAPTTTPSPSHANAQGCVSWFIANTPPGTPCTTTAPIAVPPAQGPRVQSFGTEVAAAAVGAIGATPTSLTWPALRPGTYLLESGTHPSIQAPMGLIGTLVVTCPVGAAAGTCGATAPGTAYPATAANPAAVTYGAEVPLEFSEIDPVQNTSVNAAVNTLGFSETMVWDGHTGACGNPSSSTFHQCYPPAVNYTPFYYLINGVAFNKTNVMASVFQSIPGAPATGSTLLVRLVNAGLRMHVPSIVGSLTTGYPGSGTSATQGAAKGTVQGFTLIAEDGYPLPNLAAPRVQTDVFMAAGKTFDVMVNAPAFGGTDLPIYDRELSLSGNSSERDTGMLAYIGVTGSVLPGGAAPGTGVFAGAKANDDNYNSLVAGQTFSVTDTSKGVIANDVNVYGVTLLTPATSGVVTLNANGTFTYTPSAGSAATSDSFTYCATNGFVTATSCAANLTATVHLGKSGLAGNPSAITQSYTARTATYLKVASPGLLVGNTDPSNLPITVVPSSTSGLVIDADGGFSVSSTGAGTGASTTSFNYTVQNSQGRQATGTVNVSFPAPSNLQVKVVDAQAFSNCQGDSTCIAGLALISDYRWIIEEDKTFWIDPNCTTNSSITTPGCPSIVGPAGQTTIPTYTVNFHTSTMDYVAQGCTGILSCEGGQTMLDNRPACVSAGVPAGCSATAGQHIPAVCDVGNGACRPDPTGNGYTAVLPSSVHLDPTKRYYLSVLPGDAGNPFPSNTSAPTNCAAGEFITVNGVQQLNTGCGHTMSGAPVPAACNILTTGCTSTSATAFAPVTVLSLPTPLPTGKLAVMVFEDDFPLNGEQDAGGGIDVLSPNEPGLGGFNIVLWDTYGGLGDVTGQNGYDMFNQPLSNSLAGTIDPATGFDACPISQQATADPSQAGITGMIVTCPKYESDGMTLSPLAGQAIIANLMPEKFAVQAYPGADRIARGEEWIQTNTLDGQHPHDSFIRIGEPGYFQEYGPAGYHVSIGFVNPKIVNARHDAVCSGAFGPVTSCTGTITGQVDVQRMSRTPDQRLYPSGSRDALTWTQCWVSLGDPDAEDFMFTKCDTDGNFQFTGVPDGNWRITIGDQWDDQIIDGLSTPANIAPGQTLALGKIGVQQWHSNVYTKVFIDDNKNGIPDPGEIGIPLIYTRVYYRDGHNSNGLTSDFNGVANFNETFPLFNWYVVEADTTRYKTTGIHTVYDSGGPSDGSTYCGPGNGARACGTSTAYNLLANTYEAVPLPADLSVPGAVYCATADCTAEGGSNVNGALFGATGATSHQASSTGRIDPPWVVAEGWSGLTGQGNWIEFGKAPYAECPPACAAVTGATTTAAINTISESGTTVTVVTSSPNGFISGSTVTIAGVTPAGYNGTFAITVISPTSFTYTAATSGLGAGVVTTSSTTTAAATQVGENGGIQGFVAYASTRPFDTAEQMVQQAWEPNVPRVTVNLYQEGFAGDGVTPTLKLVDTTKTSSWDDWAQGFYPNSTATPGTGQTAAQKPYMNCPGQGTNVPGSPNQDLFFYTLFDQPNYLDWYNGIHSTPQTAPHALPYNSQYKCYDAMHIWNQIQPAPYDGKYSFPSVLGIDPTTGKQITPAGVTAGVNNVGTSNFVSASMPGTNCTICVANPDSTDKYRFGTPMLPPGKYVLEVIMPPGFEVYKEEDKNLLIGDNYIAPAVVQFAGLGGDIFIIPDQASVASLYDQTPSGFNPTNYQNSTTGLGLSPELSGTPGFPGFQDPVWPCVGEMRVVPDYLSLFPQVKETAPFAGATRPLCDRKEVTLANQMSVRAHFDLFTSTHIASKFTGVITDDFTSEFDPFAPQFGEKFAPPNMPVSTRDYLGNEISRVYSDHFGIYDGLTFSSWEVNPPNITGYSPTMMVQCMNDPGPIPDPAHPGQTMTDPLYNPAYSNFCYEEPYMPGLTTYLDTPVVPTQAFVGAGFNNPDCSYPDTTPAIAEVDGDGIGPWVSAAGHTLTITALGDQTVNNFGYSGPAASVAPFNLKTVTHHYGFGTNPTVTIGGVPTSCSGSDLTLTCTVPGAAAGDQQVPLCPVQQQAQYASFNPPPNSQPGPAQCGQLVITTANGKRSVDTVTVTIGGKAPTHVAASGTIQAAIDAAAPGDLIIVDPTCTTGTGTATTVVSCTTTGAAKTKASHTEMLIMWKPVRLQGAGAATTIINANTHPAGKLLDPWRRHMVCFFGLTTQGVPIGNTTPYDSTYSCPDSSGTPWAFFNAQGQTVDTRPVCVGPNNPVGCSATGGQVTSGSVPQIDRLPLEATVGWTASLNGNLAELLQEPTLMGAYEGAGITVLAKGLDFHGQSPWNDGFEAGAFPLVTTLLTGVVSNPGGVTGLPGALLLGDANPLCHTSATVDTNPFPSNYVCNPSSIDGLSITNSSQGGGGIFVHGWAHYLQIANNRIYNNVGTLSGGISVGQGEFALPYIQGGATNAAPGSCSNGAGFVANQHLPMCLQVSVNVHNNFITDNASIGDELFSATLSGGGGATVCTGNDFYNFNYNWVCGNISVGEGGGMVHLGEIQDGRIVHNSFVFNQSSNPTIPTNGGGIMVQGTPDTDPVCPGVADTDCPPGLSDGIGHNLLIDANLIQGNSADSGSGGGIRLQQVNGTEVGTFHAQPQYWNNVTITNNIIANNMAGWDGAGISLQDALNVHIVNNTITHNDSLATSGVLTQSVGTPQASAPPGNCTMAGPTGANSASCPQSAGVTSTLNSSLLLTAMNGLAITCPQGQSAAGCRTFSNPILYNNIVWQNRSFHVGITGSGAGTLNQQNLIGLFDAISNAPAPNQASTGACSTGVTYWDIGVRGDPNPGTAGHPGARLAPRQSLLSSGNYGGNLSGNPSFISQYCNGSRVPPECTVSNGCGGPHGFGVPPGISDAVTPNPLFSLVPSATVDEGNNWINVSWGPLSMTSPSIQGPNANWGGGLPLGNYSLIAGSGAIDRIALSALPAYVAAPTTDFFGNPRPNPDAGGSIDVGAVETNNPATIAASLTSISPNTGVRGTSVSVTLTGSGLTGASAINVSGAPGSVTVSGIGVVSDTTVVATFTISATAALNSRNVTVVTPNGTTNAVTFTVQSLTPTLTSISPIFGERRSAVNVTLTGTNLGGGTINVPAGSGITVSNVVVNAAGTSITATFTIGNVPDGGRGNRAISVTTPNGTSGTVNFRITGAVLSFAASGLNTGGRTVKNGTVTITNSTGGGANAGPTTFSAYPTIARATGSGTFTIPQPNSGSCTATTTLNPGQNCTIAVTYTPPTSLLVSPTSTATITVTGSGLAAATQTSLPITGN